MSGKKRKKFTLEDLLKENLRKNAVIKHSASLRTINSGVISLFWEIGSLINTHLNNNDSGDDEKQSVSLISKRLVPVFGAYLATENLLLMKTFAQKCSAATMREVSPFINWEYIPICLHLYHHDSWISCVEHIHTESLSPQQLKEKISEQAFNLLDKKTQQNPLFIRLVEGNDFFDRHTLNLYFGQGTEEIFRHLFEPRLPSEPNFAIQSAEKGSDQQLILQIYNRVLAFQSTYNYFLNNLFNCLCWETGNEIIRLSVIFDAQVNDRLLDTCIAELNETFPFIFNKEHLSDCIKFAEQFTEPLKYTELTQTVSWPFIKILNHVDGVEKQLYIARRILNEAISMVELEGMLADGSFNLESNNESLFKVTETDDIAQVENTRNENSTVTVTKRVQEPMISSTNDLNRNIFKNPDLLKFLKN